MSLKRPPSPCDRDDKSPKRRAVEPINVADDDLEAILLQIEQQEESEALARRLQAEWDNDPGESSHGPRGGPHSPIMIEDEESNVIENDEALAKRLAAEWAREDSTAAHNAPSGQSSQMANHGQSCTNTKCKGKTSPLDATPDIVLEDYRDFFVGPRNCTKCNHEIISPRGFVTYSTQIPPPSLLALLHVLCPDCQTVFCRGCSRVLPCPTSCRGMGKDKSPICPVWTCCAEVRAIALFEALGGFDRHYIGERATSASRSKEAMQRYRSTGSKSVGPGGTGYGTGYDGGYGHGGSGNGGSRGRGGGRSQHVESGPSWLMGLAAHADVVVVRALTTITQLLPAPYSDSPHDYDMIPHATTATLILASHLPELLASLLRNDSVTDWTSRSDVYNAMLGLLRRMSDCELTLEVIIGERHEMEKSGGLEEWMWGDTEISWVMSGEEMVKLNSLYSHFQKLTKQCEAFLSGASQMLESGEEPNEDVESIIKSTSLCGEIIAARDDLERAMKAMNRDSTHTQSDSQSSTCVSDGSKKRQTDQASNDALVKKYANECERLAFHHVSFPQKGGNYSTFNFANLVTSTASSTRNPKDRLHLIKELAVMATSLPPGVWVRVDEVRNDVLKIMIAGPEGTPYAGGLFEFDCFLPLEYPHKPPLMHLRTTGGGSVRFNPNLYNNGKVCLSLLGTWPGRPEEQWTSKSTLLQVLVSIQSMILVDLPYFNEPGFGNANPTHRQSIAYNRNIAVQTVRWAMVEWLKDEHKTSMWADVIKTHFSLLSPKITQSIEKWAAEEPRMKAYTPNQHGARGHIPGPGIFTQAMIPPMATAHLTQTMGIANGINAAGAAMTHNSGPPGNSANGSRSGSAQAGGINLLEEFSKGLRVVEAWSAGTYTSPMHYREYSPKGMPFRRLGSSGLRVPLFSLGGWLTLGESVTGSSVKDIIQVAFDNGINMFDTAEGYNKGQSEIAMGQAFKDLNLRRSDIIVTTKIFFGTRDGPNDTGLSRKHIVEGTRESLERLQLEYVDVIFAHVPDYTVPIEETVRAFNYVIEKGWAMYWATSEWSARDIEEAHHVATRLGLIAPIAEQCQHNMFHRERPEREYLPLYGRYGLGTTVWSPLAGGLLTGKYTNGIPPNSRLALHASTFPTTINTLTTPSGVQKLATITALQTLAASPPLNCTVTHLALAWLAHPRHHTSSIILGASTPEQVLDNLKAVEVVGRLTEEVMEKVEGILGNRPEGLPTFGRPPLDPLLTSKRQ